VLVYIVHKRIGKAAGSFSFGPIYFGDSIVGFHIHFKHAIVIGAFKQFAFANELSRSLIHYLIGCVRVIRLKASTERRACHLPIFHVAAPYDQHGYGGQWKKRSWDKAADGYREVAERK
jgi:hypothetical protein